jgi:hypothetical protein
MRCAHGDWDKQEISVKNAKRPASVALWAIAAVAALAIVAGASTSAQAYPEGPYCWENYGRLGPGRVCTFYTYEQCLATSSGVGGTCSRNPWYEYYLGDEPDPVPPPRHRKPRHHVPS